MKTRKNQQGQVLVYFGVCILAFFALAAVAVDVGRHVFVGREAQAVADATALAGATALARGRVAVEAATGFAPQDIVDGQPATIRPSDVQVGTWDGSAFAPGGSPPNAVSTAPSFTIHNIFGLWSPTSAIQRKAVAAFQGAPQLPIVLCNKDWTSGVTLRLSSSNGSSATGDTAAWAIYDPQATRFAKSVVVNLLPKGCGGNGWNPPPQTVGNRVYLGNGALDNSTCTGLTQPTCRIVGQTYLFPIVDADCYGALAGPYTIIGFVAVKIDIDGVDCVDTPRTITGHVVNDCATAPSAASCPSAGLVK